MPGRNGTGPLGMGSMTGRGFGFCRSMNNGAAAGGRFGRNAFGCGFGYGRRSFGAAFGVGSWNPAVITKDDLRLRAQELKAELDWINETLSEQAEKAGN